VLWDDPLLHTALPAAFPLFASASARWVCSAGASCLDVPQCVFRIAAYQSGKSGEVQMTIGELNTNREAWNDRIFVLMGILVLIAIICAVIL
jgi:hypothetical protein